MENRLQHAHAPTNSHSGLSSIMGITTRILERTLYEIVGAVGTPLLIDNVTRNRLYGHYARVLVNMDLSKDIFYEIMVEREGFAFPLAIEYEGLPNFCKHCTSIGHDVSKCRWLYPRKDDSNHKPSDGKGK